MRYIFSLYILFFFISLNATEFINGNISNDVRKCERIQTDGYTQIVAGSDVEIVSNASVVLKPGFKVSSANNTNLHIYIDEEDCCECAGTMTDARDNKTYGTVRIGDQVWMSENLDYSTEYSYSLNQFGTDFGQLYYFGDYMSGSQTEGTQGVCPSGWHIPTVEEFLVLLEPYNSVTESFYALKENGSTGFNAIPNGYLWSLCNSTGIIVFDSPIDAAFGSSSTVSEDESYKYILAVNYLEPYTPMEAGIAAALKCPMNSIRCLRDCSRSTTMVSNKTAKITNTNVVAPEQFIVPGFKIHPNPSTGIVHIEIPESIDGEKTIKIVNLTGSVVYETSVSGNYTTLDLENICKGLYNIIIDFENGQTREQIIIQ